LSRENERKEIPCAYKEKGYVLCGEGRNFSSLFENSIRLRMKALAASNDGSYKEKVNEPLRRQQWKPKKLPTI